MRGMSEGGALSRGEKSNPRLRFGLPLPGGGTDGQMGPARLQQLGDQAGPPGLMRRPDAAPGVAVEVLVKEQVVAEERVRLQLLLTAEHRPSAVAAAQEDPR